MTPAPLLADFIHNGSLLLSLAVLFALLQRFMPAGSGLSRATTGVLFGLFAVVGMLVPVHPMPGIIFDGRSVILAAAGVVGGALPAAIAAAIAGAYRAYLGGVGVLPGVGTVVSSAVLGVLYGHLAATRPRLMTPLPLLGLAVVVHLVVLAWMFTLPGDLPWQVLRRVSVPLLVVLPPVMVMLLLLLRGITTGMEAERLLREREAWFRHVVAEAPFPTMVHAEDGSVLAVNRAWSEGSGYGADELPTVAAWTRLAYGDRAPQVRAGIERLFALDQRVEEGEFHPRMKSGEVRDWRFSTAPLGRLPDGRRVMVTSAVDVTEENRLRRRLEFTDALVHQSQEPLYVLDPADGFRLVFVNDAACRHFGYSRERLLQMRVADWDLDDAEGWLAEHWDRHSGGARVFERVHRRGDGGEVPVEIIANRMVVNERRLEVGAIHDLTERKAAEAALAEAWERLERVLANIPDGVLVYDSGLRIRYANPAAAALTGRPVPELVGRRDQELWPPGVYQVWQPALEKALAGDAPGVIEGWLPFPDTSPRQVRLRLVPVRDRDGAVLEVLAIAEDLTEMHAAEARALARTRERDALAAVNARLQELDRLKSLFIASMSHELRTPLNSIIGFSAVLLQDMAGPLAPEQRDLLGRVHRSGRHLLALINDVIDVSKIEAGKVEAYRETFPLAEVIGEAVDTVRPEAAAKDLDLRVQVDGAPALTSDRRRVLQCLLNLVGNAVKYTEAGAIRVTVHDLGERVAVAVADTGIGVPAGEAHRLFQQFSRIDSPLARTSLGTGLGLYLSRKLAVEVLGGDLDYAPEPGGGSRFTLTLPKEPAPP